MNKKTLKITIFVFIAIITIIIIASLLYKNNPKNIKNDEQKNDSISSISKSWQEDCLNSKISNNIGYLYSSRRNTRNIRYIL